METTEFHIPKLPVNFEKFTSIDHTSDQSQVSKQPSVICRSSGLYRAKFVALLVYRGEFVTLRVYRGEFVALLVYRGEFLSNQIFRQLNYKLYCKIST